DVLDVEALQARRAGGTHVPGAAIDDALARVSGFAHEAELGGEEHLPAPARERTAEQHLVGEGTVRVRRVPAREPEVERAAERGECGGLIVGAVDLAHAHAAQAERGHLGAVATERAGLHGSLLTVEGAIVRPCAAAGEYAIRERLRAASVR